jgi:nitrate/nitrite-specific signal transduction histidine kinase
MTERVRILGGELSFHSREGQGTTVTVSIKLKGKYSGQKSNLPEFRR